MGQKVNPISFRLGVINSWDSVWYEDKKSYAKNFHEDLKIRKFIKERYNAAGISKVTIERFPDRVNINIFTARPGILIGRKGADIDIMKKEIQKFASRKVNININEEKKVEQNATLVAEQIANQLKARFPFRRAVKQAITSAIRGGALGIKVAVSGRLNGAEMSRYESYSEGRTPLHTLRANIDYGFAEALTTFGLIGVKVWIYKGDVLSGKEAEEDEYTVKRRKS